MTSAIPSPLPGDEPFRLSEADQAKNQLASDWMHAGIDLLGETSVPVLERAVRCFDQAIALRRTLPLEENPFLRYALSAGWINRGDALARIGDGHLDEALRSYGQALALLEGLPLEENVLYPRRLAITWINRGTALQRRQAAGDAEAAARGFRAAISVLDHPAAAALADAAALRSGAWANLAGALASAGAADGAEAIDAAARALALAAPLERADAAVAEAALQARHLVCRLAVQELADRRPLPEERRAAAIAAATEGIALARHWRGEGHGQFEETAREIFRFGCRIQEGGTPQALIGFLEASLGGEPAPDAVSLAAARAALWSCLAHLQAAGFGAVGTPAFATRLADIQALRQAEDRLRQ